MNIVNKISVVHIFMKQNLILYGSIDMTSLSILLPIINILENQVAKMSGSEHVQVAKVLVANRSGSKQV